MVGADGSLGDDGVGLFVAGAAGPAEVDVGGLQGGAGDIADGDRVGSASIGEVDQAEGQLVTRGVADDLPGSGLAPQPGRRPVPGPP